MTPMVVTFTGSADYEHQPSYSFSVVATDAAGNSSQPHVVSMQVENVDEVGPTITSPDTAIILMKTLVQIRLFTQQQQRIQILMVKRSLYSVLIPSDGAFSINAETGEVSLAVDPDFEVQDQYSFTVIATDGNQKPITVSLSINDVDDFVLKLGKVYLQATQSLMDDVTISMHHKGRAY